MVYCMVYHTVDDKGIEVSSMDIFVKKGDAKDGGFIIRDKVHITSRELMVLMLMANGISNEQIAKRLGIRLQTVRNHLQNMIKKLKAENTAHAVSLCIHYGMLKLGWDEGGSVDDEGKEKSLYVWCLHCERTYLHGQFRKVKGEKFVVNHVKYDTSYEGCVYEDCNGSAVLDAWDWNYVRENHEDYPEVPEKDKVYPLYD